MSLDNHYANCKGCVSLDEIEGVSTCLNLINWLGSEVPKDAFCYAPALYRHPDGVGRISFDKEARLLIVENENTGNAICIPIGQHGLLELGHALIAEALKEGV